MDISPSELRLIFMLFAGFLLHRQFESQSSLTTSPRLACLTYHIGVKELAIAPFSKTLVRNFQYFDNSELKLLFQ